MDGHRGVQQEAEGLEPERGSVLALQSPDVEDGVEEAGTGHDDTGGDQEGELHPDVLAEFRWGFGEVTLIAGCGDVVVENKCNVSEGEATDESEH